MLQSVRVNQLGNNVCLRCNTTIETSWPLRIFNGLGYTLKTLTGMYALQLLVIHVRQVG